MSEFISSPIFLILAAILGVLLLIALIKGAIRFVIWLAIIAAILIGLDFITQGGVRDWLENLLKTIRQNIP